MDNIFKKLDQISQINQENKLVMWLERLAFIFLILMVLAEPHSIAATQIAWLIGMTIWVVRLFIKPRLKPIRTPLDLPIFLFCSWSLISAIFSYTPDISLGKTRNVLLILILYYVINSTRTKQAVMLLVSLLIFSCMVGVIGTPIQRIWGRGIEIYGIKADSPFKKTKPVGDFTLIQVLNDGDTVLRANNYRIESPDELLAEVESNEITQLKIYRPDVYAMLEIKRTDLLNGSNSLEKLGIENWKKNHYWRSQWSYSHYTTFAEVLQLIGSLIFGLLITSIEKGYQRGNKSKIVLFAVCYLLLIIALFLTVTRASEIAILAAAAAMVLINGNRKLILGLGVVIFLLVLLAVFFLKENRQIGFIDSADSSTQYRLMMYRDGLRLWTSQPRNFVLGVGMDSIKRYWREWDLFDKGWQPIGHFHSTVLQLLVERGFPALLFWLWILAILARTFWNYLAHSFNSQNLTERGVVLGALGSLIGFFISGLAHYNLGDSEVAMGFFLIMGLGFSLSRSKQGE